MEPVLWLPGERGTGGQECRVGFRQRRQGPSVGVGQLATGEVPNAGAGQS